jgi:hypothetical protein
MFRLNKTRSRGEAAPSAAPWRLPGGAMAVQRPAHARVRAGGGRSFRSLATLRAGRPQENTAIAVIKQDEAAMRLPDGASHTRA